MRARVMANNTTQWRAPDGVSGVAGVEEADTSGASYLRSPELREPSLFVAQREDGIDPAGAARGNESRQGGGQAQAGDGQDKGQRVGEVHAEELALRVPGEGQAGRKADREARGQEQERLPQHEPDHVAPERPQR